MADSTNEDIQVTDSTEDFEFWINKSYIPETLKPQLLLANVLLVPREDYREGVPLVFPVGTGELFAYLRELGDKSIKPEICIQEEDYRELALHFDFVVIPIAIVRYLLAPLFVRAVYDFIKHQKGNKLQKTKVIFEMTVVKDGGTAAHIRYEGPVEGLQTLVQSKLNLLGQGTSEATSAPNGDSK